MITNFTKSNILRKKASNLIPGGAHTYSKGDDQFPQLSPHSIVRGEGAIVWDVDGNRFVDWGMGLTSVLLGHAYKPIIKAITDELGNGVNFIRPSFIEAEVAEQMVEQIPSAQMVKFSKNGSNATTSAVKLARAYTEKEIILRCLDQPFFSIDDWFIGDTEISSGVTQESKSKTKHFRYNNIEDLKSCIDRYRDSGIACIIMEASATQEPKEGYLEAIRDICTKEDIILIFDEVVSGFRFHPKGAQFLYGVTPDLSTFGKTMANGYSISALVGKRDIMQLGGLEHNKERVFLLSTTYGGETHHLRATQKTIEILNHNDYEVTKYVWSVGKKIKESYNQIVKQLGLEGYTSMEGIDCRPYFYFKDNYMRTLFAQEMIKYGVLIQGIVPSFSHQESEIAQTIEAFEKSLKLLSFAIESNRVQELLIGEPIKPVFRKYN
jgi:glutamate-1-semialdehyde 2,1-aminomutase